MAHQTTPTAITSNRSGRASPVDDDRPGLEAHGLWRPGDNNNVWSERIAELRIAIDQARQLT